MKLLSCHIENFGSIRGETLQFDGALTAFCRANGAGKTTLASFLKAMFYGMESDRANSKFGARRHFNPFGGGLYGGNGLVFYHPDTDGERLRPLYETICRALDAPLVNLGFSGNARGETAIADAIAGLELAAFVYDYDYNAPDADWLCRTHEPFFRRIRIAQPELPILLLSRCSRPEPGRRDVVRRTFEQAVAAGDRQVRFIDGSELFQPAGEAYCTVDGCHPNDLGFYLMFRRTLPVLREMLGLS